jgi:hypothetical protein
MTNRFMISVAAAALIAGTGFANAQGTGTSREAPSAGSTVQQTAPSSDRGAPSAAPMNRDSATDHKGADKGSEKGMKATQSDEKMQPGATKNQHVQDDMKPGAKGEKAAQDNNMKGEKSKSMSSETNEKGAAGKDMKAEGREDRNGMKAEGRDGRMNAETKGGVDSKSQTTTQSQTNQSQTTGQAGAGAKLSTEQRTKITTVIKEQHVQPVTNVNFSISVGTRVPRSGITFHALPAEIVTVYPQWRGYEYILVRDQILVIDPRTGEIVDVIDT